jgi:hypothetical protein
MCDYFKSRRQFAASISLIISIDESGVEQNSARFIAHILMNSPDYFGHQRLFLIRRYSALRVRVLFKIAELK